MQTAAALALASTLVTTGTDRFGDGETIVRYGQAHQGLPVIGHGAAVRLSKNGTKIAEHVHVASDLPASVVPTLSAHDAASVTSRRIAFGAKGRDAHLVIWPTFDRGPRLAYVVLPPIATGIPTMPRVVVDAHTGEILEVRDMVRFANAKMYETNPVKSPTLASLPLALTPTSEMLTNPFIQSTNCLDKKTVKSVSMFGINLDVHVCDLVQVATANGDGDFVYEPSDAEGSTDARSDPFSEVSIYYHTAKAYAFFRDLQGNADAQVCEDKPLRLIANLQVPAGMTSGNFAAASDPNKPLDTFQNAFFSPAAGGLGQIFEQLYGFEAGALWFGQGPKRDYAYDGDVVYHEFTHSVVDATLKLGAWHVDKYGAIDAPGAMNEGLADYFSSALSGDPNVGEYASLDLGGTNGAIRTLDNHDRCPTSVIGEVHFDSTLFSGALWQARASLPEADRKKFDAGIYKAMRMNPGESDLGYEDLTKLFDDVLKADFPAGATALEAALGDHGITDCARVLEYKGQPIASPDSRLGFWAPGTQSVSVKNVAPGVLQFSAPMKKSATAINVAFKAKTSTPNPLTGGGKPFAPLILAKFGQPITWDAKKGHDADVKAAVAAGDSASVTLDVPEGTTAETVYVQIASTGESDGSYDSIEITVAGADTPDPTTAASTPKTTTTETGCGCTTIGARTAALPSGILAALGLLMLRQRRKSR